MKSLVVLFCVLGVSVAQTVTIDPVGAVTVVEGNNLTINCTDGVSVGSLILLRKNGVRLSGDNTPPTEVNGMVRTFHLPVDRTKNGNTYNCEHATRGTTSATITLTVTYPPQFSPSSATATPTEGDQFTLPLSLEGSPLPTIDNLTLNGILVADTRFTVTTTNLTIADVTRDDSGEYQLTASNVVGSDTFTLTVDVYYPPQFAIPSQNVTRNATGNEVFTFDCTPSGGNPAVYSYTFLNDSVPVTEGVNGSVLTINPVERSSRGMYTCTANNTVGTAVVTRNLIINLPPTMPLNLSVVNLLPFSATLQWYPPSDNGGSSLPLTYTLTLTNTFTSLSFSDVIATSLPLINLQHSTQYSWSVQAMNEYGSSPPAVSNFSTPDSVPIIDSVEVAVLSLFEVEVNISLLTNGGQSVTQYTVEVNGMNYTFPSSEQMQASLLLNQLSVNFTKGERFTLSAFALNSVGTSNLTSVDVIVPSPPNITASPSKLDFDDVPVCCAGVQLNLANPDDPSIQVQVLINGTSHPANQVTRNGSFLYIMGLQAGTEYPLNITLSNIFGTVWVNATVRPLLGRPSTPQVTLTPTTGGLTVQLTVMYPGTREDTLQYSISTSASIRSRRQTGQQTLTVTDLTTPVSGSAEVALGPGTYSVTVNVTNQHDSTTSTPQQVTIPALPTDLPASTNTAVIIGVVVAVVIVILLLILAVFVIVLLYMRRKDTKATYKPKKEVNGDEKEMVDAHSTDPLAPQYEDPSTLERQPPPAVVTYKKEDEAAEVQPTPSGVVYADLDFSRQQAFGSGKKPEKKTTEPVEAVIYSEVRPMTSQEKQKLQDQQEAGGDGEDTSSPTTIM